MGFNDLHTYYAGIKFERDTPDDIEKLDHDSSSELNRACCADHFSEAENLLEKGALINWRNKFGMTSILYACRNGNYKLFTLLLEKGALFSNSDMEETALELALRGGDNNIIKELMRRGARSNGRFATEEIINKAKKDHEIIKILTVEYLAKKN
jgi:ankyrin repeat protein